jgi:hypothetical protein
LQIANLKEFPDNSFCFPRNGETQEETQKEHSLGSVFSVNKPLKNAHTAAAAFIISSQENICFFRIDLTID